MNVVGGDKVMKPKKFLPWFYFLIIGISNIGVGTCFLLNNQAIWFVYTFCGGVFIILGMWWYVYLNKLNAKPMTLLIAFIGMFLSLLASYRANFITFGYDLASSVVFVLGMFITTSSCIAVRSIGNKNKRGKIDNSLCSLHSRRLKKNDG